MEKMKFWRGIIIIAIVFAGFFGAQTAFAAGPTFTVDTLVDEVDDNPGDGACHSASGCTFRAALGEIIALGQASSTIIIGVTGTTTLSVGWGLPTLSVASTTIIGPGSNLFAIDGGGSNGIGLYITSSGNHISGFTITNFSSSDLLLSGASYNTFNDLIFSHSASNAATAEIYLGSSYNTFTNCSFIDNARIGIRFLTNSNYNTVSYSTSTNNPHSGMTSYSSHHNTFSYNYLDNNDNGMYIIDSQNVIVEHTTFVNNTSSGLAIFELTTIDNIIRDNIMINNGQGIQFSGDGTGPNNLFQNNLIASSTGYGVSIIGTSTGSIFNGNTISNNVGLGVSLSAGCSAVLINNIIANNGSWGIGNWGDGSTISGNTIYGNARGIVLSAASNNTITHNTLYDNEDGVSFSSFSLENILMDNIIWSTGNVLYVSADSGIANTYNLLYSDGGVLKNYIDSATAGIGEISANPRFTSTSTNDFSLKSYSPAIGAASDGGDLGAIDFTGTPLIWRTYTVNTTTDMISGNCEPGSLTCTLREALTQVNALTDTNLPVTIEIIATGTLNVSSTLPLPILTHNYTTIAGPGVNDFIIDGGITDLDDNRYPYFIGLEVQSDYNEIYGFTIRQFSGFGLFLNGADNNNVHNLAINLIANMAANFEIGDGSDHNTVTNYTAIGGRIGLRIIDNSNDNYISDSTSTAATHSGMTIYGQDDPSILAYSHNNTIIHNAMISGGQNGMYILQGAYDNLIEDNDIIDNVDYGVSISDGTTPLYGTKNNIFRNNRFSGSNTGISIGYGGTGAVIFEDNEIFNNHEGITIFQNNQDSIIRNNIIRDNTNYGISTSLVEAISHISIIDNIISNNSNFGIVVDEGATLFTISGNTISSSTIGISIDASDSNTVDDNIIRNNLENGISINNANHNIISGNTIFANGEDGIVISSATQNLIDANTIYGHGTTSVGSNWLAALSPLKYNATIYHDDFLGDCSGNPAVFYTSNIMDMVGICDGQVNIPSTLENNSGGAWDVFLLSIPGDIHVTFFFSAGALTRSQLEAMIQVENSGPGGTVEAGIYRILSKVSGVWQYNGIVDGVNGVSVETRDGGVISLVDVAPGITAAGLDYPYSAIYLNHVTSSTFSNNNLSNNGNGVVVAGASNNNTFTNDTVSSLGHDFEHFSTGTDTFNNVLFKVASTTISSGQINVYYDARLRLLNSNLSPAIGINSQLANTSLNASDSLGYTNYAPIHAYDLNSTGYINVLNPQTVTIAGNSGYDNYSGTATVDAPSQTIDVILSRRNTGGMILSASIGCQNNTLIKYPSSPKIYFIENCLKRWITDEYSFNQAHYDWNSIQTTTLGYLDGQDITFIPVDPIVPIAKYVFKKLLKLGMTGEDVKQLQLKLKQLGYFTHPTATGYFGNITVIAVKKFQSDHKLSPAGYVGPGTRLLLNNH